MTTNNLKTFRVYVHERWVQTYEVQATSPEEAKHKASHGQGTALDNECEYIEPLDNPADWTVDEVDEK